MEKIDILIVEDDKDQTEALIHFLENKNYNVVYSASSLKAAIDFYDTSRFDIAIIDIYLDGEPDGIEFAKVISEKGGQPFVFLTNSNDKTIFDKAKNTNPHSYLIKPYNELELQFAIELALEKSANESTQPWWQNGEGALFINTNFFLKKRDKLIKVKSSEIIYIEVDGRYCKLITELGSFLVLSSLKTLLIKMKLPFFLRTHRNYAVNIEMVKEVLLSDNIITMKNDTTVFLSETYKTDFLERYTLLK